jgi:hypothetical protein
MKTDLELLKMAIANIDFENFQDAKINSIQLFHAQERLNDPDTEANLSELLRVYKKFEELKSNVSNI